MSETAFEVVTPDGVLYKHQVSSLTVRGIEGYLTVLPKHFPLVTGVTNCICHFNCSEGLVKAFCGNGILEVSEKEIKLIVSSFNFKEDIDIERARRALERATKYLESNDPSIDKKRAQEALIRAESRIALWEGH